MKRFWLSWYAKGADEFELHSPWWSSGWRTSDNAETICAAIIAQDEADARTQVQQAHTDKSVEIEWRFCNQRPDDWSPFCERFCRADWMIWPS
jgi:hypothetical protein